MGGKLYRRWLWCLLMITCFISITDGSEGIVESCGSHLTSPRGVIHTPNFPGPFTVPIKCRWVIDASDVPFTNNSIVVYLTQLYVYKGLTFTEYAYYESELTHYGATVIKKITEGNVLEYRWFKTSRPFLVIEFELDRLEGNHIRVLHDLLNVYGFNITYEMTETDVNPESCTIRDCSFLGNCILNADYKGHKCSNGPLCMDENRNTVCRNGGTCNHIGAEAVRCHCLPDFTGHNCEIPIFNEVIKGCASDTCIMQCPFISSDRRPCDCKDKSPVYNNRARYECRIKLSNATSLRTSLTSQSISIETLLRKQAYENRELTTFHRVKPVLAGSRASNWYLQFSQTFINYYNCVLKSIIEDLYSIN
ncbi:hypothetical protein PV325_007704 [Microctonus aethiopoides]|nr:hypothetical protein PV325_007704 [Microctonus aethiopoides]